jgi:hypothetical protein
MSFPTVGSAGTSDSVFIRKLRLFMEDEPLFSPEQLSANGSSTEYRVSQFPVHEQGITIKVGASTQTLQPDRQTLIGKGANNICIDYETGWVFWDVAPVSGVNNIQFRKDKVRWRNERMLEALYTGLKMMFPLVWQKVIDSTSITLNVNQWDYTLPVVFSDPRVKLYQVEVQSVPTAYERFHIVQNWRRVGPTTLQVPLSQYYYPGSLVRLSYYGPYQALADLEEQLEPLPLWYAKGYLLSNKETVRARFDQSTTTQDVQANPVGTSQNAGEFYFRKFYQALDALKRPLPVGPVLVNYQA